MKHNMVVTTTRLAVGDVVHEVLAWAEQPERHVVLDRLPAGGSVDRDGWPVPVLFVTGTDLQTGCAVRWTASPWKRWYVLRQNGVRAELARDHQLLDGRWVRRPAA